jgi:hypothetical protein
VNGEFNAALRAGAPMEPLVPDASAPVMPDFLW